MKLRVAHVLVALVLLLPLAGIVRVAGAGAGRWLDWAVALGIMFSPAVALGVLWNPFRTGTLRAMALHVLTVLAAGVALMVVLRGLGVPATTCATALVVVPALVCAVALIRLRRLEWQAEPSDAMYLGVALCFAVLLYLRVSASFFGMMGAHGLWHEACALKTIEAVPPECPVYAGYPYYMYWAYDTYMMELSLATQRTLGELALVAWLLVLPVAAAAYGLGQLLFASERWRWVYTIAALAGLNGAAAALLAMRLGAHPGEWAAYRTYDRLNELAITYRWNGCVYSLPIGFTGGAGMGLVLYFGVVYLAAQALTRGARFAPLAILALLIVGALMVHPVSGGVALLVAGVMGLTGLLGPGRTAAQRRSGLYLGLAGLAAVVVCLPYLRTMMGEYADPAFITIFDQPRVMAKQVWDLAGPWLWTLPLLPLGVWQVVSRRQPQAAPFLVLSVLLGLLAVTLRLPWDNQYKLVYLQAPLICAVALVGLAAVPYRGLRRLLAGGLVGLLLASMLTGVVVCRLRYASAPFPYASQGGQVVMKDPTGDVAALWQWVSGQTDPRAVIIEAPFGVDTETALLEPTLLAGRTGFTSTAGRAYEPYTKESWQTGGYPDCEQREAIANALSAGQPLTAAQWDLLRRLQRPLYLLLRADNTMVKAGAEAALQALPQQFKPVFARATVRLYQILPPEER